MKKLICLLMLTSTANAVDTYTTGSMVLTKPGKSSLNWDSKVNTNFDVIAATVGASVSSISYIMGGLAGYVPTGGGTMTGHLIMAPTSISTGNIIFQGLFPHSIQFNNQSATSTQEFLGEIDFKQGGSINHRIITYGAAHATYPGEMQIGGNSALTGKVRIAGSTQANPDLFVSSWTTVGVNTANPKASVKLDVNGDTYVGGKIGIMKIPFYSLDTTGAAQIDQQIIVHGTATIDGALTATGGVIGASSLNVLKSGDTMTGPLTLSGSSLTVTGDTLMNGGELRLNRGKFIYLNANGGVSAPYFGSPVNSGFNFTTQSSTNPFVFSNGKMGVDVSVPSSKLEVAGDITTTSSITVQGNAFSVGGSTLVVNQGKVGIGISSPLRALHIKDGGPGNIRIEGTDNTQEIGIDITPVGALSSTNNRWILGRYANADKFQIARYDGSSESYPFIIGNTGNVGIGTTAPFRPLHIQNTNHTQMLLSDTEASGVYGLELGFNDSGTTYATVFNKSPVGENSSLHFGVGSSTGMSLVYNTNGGASVKLGIGTTAPLAPLHVSITASTQAMFSGGYPGAPYAGSGGVVFGNDPANQGLIGYDSGTGGTVLFLENTRNNAAGEIRMRFKRASGSPVDTLTALASGNVGIGTTAPESKLTVAGGAVRTPKVIITQEGGIAIMMTNASGVAIASGTIVNSTGSAVDYGFLVNPLSGSQAFGVVYGSTATTPAAMSSCGVADKCWIIVSGLAYVRIDAGACANGNWAGASTSVAGKAECGTEPASTAQHDREVGHVVVAKDAANMAWMVWNSGR